MKTARLTLSVACVLLLGAGFLFSVPEVRGLFFDTPEAYGRFADQPLIRYAALLLLVLAIVFGLLKEKEPV